MTLADGLFLLIGGYSFYLFLGITTITLLCMVLLYKTFIRRSVKKHLANLTTTSQHLNAIINSLNDIIFEFNDDKLCLNAWYNSLTERPIDPKELVGQTIESMLGPERAAKYNEALDYVIKNHKPTSIEYLSEHGTGKWFIAKLTPVFDQAGNYAHRITVSVSDITQQRKYAETLQDQERLLTEAQSIAKIGNWLFESKDRKYTLSNNFKAILGIKNTPKGVDAFDFYISLCHPDDRHACHDFLLSSTKKEVKQHEHRIVTPDGRLKFIKIIIGDKIFNAEGQMTRIFGIIQDITDIRLSDKALKKGRAELIEAQTIAKIGNWNWTPSARRLVCSDEVYNIFEVSNNILQQSDMRTVLTSYVHPNDKFILQHLLKNAAVINNYTCVFRIVTPKGDIKYISIIVGKLLRTESGRVRKIIGTLQDVTDRKKAEIDYKRTENKYKLVLESIKLAAISLNSEGYVIFCNQYLANLLGYTQKEILGMHWFDNFIPPEVKEHMGSLHTTNAVPQEYINPVVCRSGEQRIISWQNTVSYDENGFLKETTSIGEDVTDRQKATQALISAKELAERSSKFKSDFLSIMSHEIRTPMNAVIGTTNLLIHDNPRPDQLEYLNILKFSGENLLAIINDILDYNKIEAGKLELSEMKFNIYSLVQQITQTFAAKAAEKKLLLNLSIDNTIPEFLIGDQNRLSQILNNLISNAVKFTLKGGITINLVAQEVSPAQATVKFTVTDTGVGIAADNINIVFDPFVQETIVNNNNSGGTGLGLAITKRLVNLHKSDITVHSQPGQGTTFSFAITFNLPAADTNIQQAVAADNEIDKSPQIRGMKILIVDDNKMNLLVASRFLKKWNAEVDEAFNGQIAVDMVHQQPYDLIIMDLQMPVMDGFQATMAIKKAHPDIPIIALTADAMPETFTKAIEAGMSDYLTKPFVPAVFFEKIARYYGVKSSEF